MEASGNVSRDGDLSGKKSESTVFWQSIVLGVKILPTKNSIDLLVTKKPLGTALGAQEVDSK